VPRPGWQASDEVHARMVDTSLWQPAAAWSRMHVVARIAAATLEACFRAWRPARYSIRTWGRYLSQIRCSTAFWKATAGYAHRTPVRKPTIILLTLGRSALQRRLPPLRVRCARAPTRPWPRPPGTSQTSARAAPLAPPALTPTPAMYRMLMSVAICTCHAESCQRKARRRAQTEQGVQHRARIR